MALPRIFRRERDRQVPIRRGADPVSTLRHEVDRLFDDFGMGLFGSSWPALPGAGSAPAGGSFYPSIDVEDRDDEVRISAELPGLDEKDFELSLNGDTLTLRGEKKHESEEQGEGWYRTERAYGRFERHVPLPGPVQADAARAEFRQGVLKVVLPKPRDAQRRRVQIPVDAS